ncbi:MAG: multidrug effflux MFS transporter [Gammaproteobacteria bacterium]
MSLRIVFILAMVSALGPFAFDTYLPAFPDIANFLHTDIQQIGYTVSVYLLGLAVGQLIGGPLSDYWGKAKIMLIGLGIFTFASLMTVFANSLIFLLACRMLQAFGGGWGGVGVAGIVRDRFEGKEAAKVFSLIMLIMMMAPAIAPTLGSIILTIAHWQGIFIFLTLYASLVMIMLWTYVFEKSTISPLKNVKLSFFKGYVSVLQNKVALCFIMVQAFAFSIMVIFLTNASFIYQNWFAVSKFGFAGLFACNIATMFLLNMINRLLLRWVEPIWILFFSIVLQAVAVMTLIFIVYFHNQLIFFVPGIMIAVGTIGVTAPNNQACYLQFFKENSATAAALMGALQLSISGIMSGFSSFIGNRTLQPIVLCMGFCAFITVFFVILALTQVKKQFSLP